MEDPKFDLNPEIAKNYNIADGCPVVFESIKHGTIDTRTITAAKVEALIADGSKKFTAKAAPVKSKSSADNAAQ